MNKFLALLFTSLTIIPSFGQKNDLTIEEKNKVFEDKANAINTKFGNLSKEERITYFQGRSKAHQLFSKKRHFEALLEIHNIRNIFEDDPTVLNLLGAVYVEFRDFDKARKLFKHAVSISGEDPKLLFNLAELAFCSNQWSACIRQMNEIRTRLETVNDQLKEKAKEAKEATNLGDIRDTDFYRIMIFKEMLCHLALADEAKDGSKGEKENEKRANEIAALYGFMIDSPFYYYAEAAKAYYANDEIEAAKHIVTAKKVYQKNPDLTLTWDDTMVEFGYIQSHYGKHFSEGETENLLE